VTVVALLKALILEQGAAKRSIPLPGAHALGSRMEMSHSRSRRKFLYIVGGAGIISAVGSALVGAQQSATKIDHRRSRMESPIEVVRRFCAAWSDNIGAAELAAFFTDDAVYHNIPMAPVTGREAIANNIASFIRPGAPGIESIQFRVINIAANGPVVMTERVDVFKLPHKSFELPVMGTFEVSDGKISAWRDYFDMNQFTSRMG
jgi:limonene-1,2-epoxide hydrolase